jgi:soluble lytic murein transglycosylase-like protein
MAPCAAAAPRAPSTRSIRRHARRLCALSLLGLIALGVHAAPAWPAAATAACVPQAARHHGVDPWLLAAVLQVESGFRPHVVRRNANGSLDVGLAQINSIHFRELALHGISPGQLLDPCIASHVAAWHLARQLRVRGPTWQGLASYHSITPCHNQRYAAQVWNTLVGWGAVDGARVAVAPLQVCAGVPSPDFRSFQ